ncbi:MAG TPA: hypothetical protein VK017_00065 [Sphingobacterium sp.]|jgi:hypothetical protein|nr:hypothetical protein [Sphingobacterium sp.]
MKKSPFLFLILLTFSVLSCSKKQDVPVEGLEVQLEVVSGCGVVKKVSLNKAKTVKDLTGNRCEKSSKKEHYETDSAKYQQLLAHIQKLDLFRADYKDCWRCADGVDYMLVISTGDGLRNELSISRQRTEQDLVSFMALLDEL